MLPVLGGVPDAQDHSIRPTDPIHDDIRSYDDELPRSFQAPWPAAIGERGKAVARDDQFPRDPHGCRWVISRDILGNPCDVGQRARPPSNRHLSTRNGRWCVELSLRDPQEPGPHLLMRSRAWVGIGCSDRVRERTGLGLIVISKRRRTAHDATLADCAFVCDGSLPSPRETPNSSHRRLARVQGHGTGDVLREAALDQFAA